MKVGILGGTFDPIHNGHLALARAAQRQLRLDVVYFLLSPRSPFKLHHKITSASVRLKMLRLALKSRRAFRVATWELMRRGPSYTVATLAAYKKKYPHHQLFLILGSDAFAGFERWKNPDKILKLATLVIGRRPGSDVPDCLPGVAVMKGLFPAVSSTELREKLASLSFAHVPVPPAVKSFLLKRKLYSHLHAQ